MAENALLEDESPHGNLVARVEQDGRCAFFYLTGEPEGPFGVRSCWVRNLGPAPVAADAEAMKKGDAPRLPAAACAHPAGAPPLLASALRVVWFEEGDGAALLEGDQLLAIIPSWSGVKGFEGYARDCTAKSPLCWPLAADHPLASRVRRAEEFWKTWGGTDPWPSLREAGLAAVEAALGKHSNYYALSEGDWPPRGLVRVPREGATVLATVGVGIRPLPKLELAADGLPRRIELALAMESAYFDRAPKPILGWLGTLAALPWMEFTPLSAGQIVPCPAVPMTPTGVQFEAALLVADPAGAPKIAYPTYRRDAVQGLWLLPITKGERAFAEKEGGAQLASRLAQAPDAWIHRYREPVA